MITLLLLIPIIGSIILLPINENLNKLKMKQIALTTSLINFFISLFMWYQFDSNITQYQFVTEFNHLNLYHFNFGVDSISLYFVLLTTFVTPVALLSNYTNISNNLKTFLISFLILESLQICAFVSLDLLLFYIFFESDKWSRISLLCLQLSNSGNALKLIFPSRSRNRVKKLPLIRSY
jgi:NADH:ubiquinone oxidoreductase subunit 4 (subunit M)